MSNRKRLLSIIDRYTASVSELPTDLEQQLAMARTNLEQLSDEQFEKMSDRVFSTPANEHKLDTNNPKYIVQSLYSEMERAARNDSSNPRANEAIKEIQHYYGIEEKDGFFP